jgi:exopolyphosphatase/pppGpp-phosphohydrolase
VAKEKPEELSEAMAKMIVNYNNYRPDAIREYVINNFGKNKFLKRIAEVYKSAGVAIISEKSNKFRNPSNSSVLHP